MKNGFLKSFLLTLFLTIFIFSFLKLAPPLFSSKEKSSLRALNFISLSEKSIQDIRKQVCDNSDDSLLDFYKTASSDFTYSAKDGNPLVPEMIEEFIKTENISDDSITDYIMKNAKYVFYLVLLIIFILFWFPYICCACCKGCLCCFPECFSSCIKSFILIALILSGGVVICCLTGYFQNFGIFHGFFGTGCSILKLEQHLVNGDECKIQPYWIGITPIIEKLTSTEKFIENLPESTNELKNKLNTTKTVDFENFNVNLDSEYNEKKDTTITNPNPDGESRISPPLISQYEEALNGIKTEFSIIGEQSVKIIEEILNVIDLGSQAEEIKNQLNEITSFLENSVKQTDETIVNVAGNYIDYLDMADSYFRISMNYFYTVNIILLILAILSLIFLLLCSKGKCCLCISWCFLYILMITSLLLGTIFGLFGTIFRDVSYGAQYLLNKIGDSELIPEKQTRDLINTCFNGNGSLSSGGVIGLDLDFNNSQIDNIYLLENELEKAITNLSNYELTTVNTLQSKYEELLNNPTCFELINTLNNIKKYIDGNYEGNYISSSSSLITFDEWEVNETNCQKDYSILNPNDINNKFQLRNLLEENKKYCIIVQKWKKEEIIARYQNIILTMGDNTEIIGKYYDSITQYLTDNTNFMNGIMQKNIEIQNEFKSVTSKEAEIIRGIGNTVKPVREIFQEIVGDDSIFSMLNCGFLKRDTNKFLEQLDEGVGVELKTTSSIFISITIIEGILTLFTLIILTRFKEENKKITSNTPQMMEMTMQNEECQQI